MKNTLVLTALSILITSCVSLDGKLVVSEKINLKVKSGILNLQRKNVDIESNDYIAHFNTNSTNDYSLELDHGSDKIEIPIVSENNLNIPKSNGEFRISHNEIGQPYDLKGNLTTLIKDTATIEIVEECTTYTSEVRCSQFCDSNFTTIGEQIDSQLIDKEVEGEQLVPSCHRECHNVQIPHPGNQNVAFHYTTTTRDLIFDFLKSDTEQSVARFVGGNTETKKVIEHASVCL